MELPSSLTKKLGPLPVWAWGVVIGGAWLAVGVLKGGTSAKAATSGPFATAPAGGGGDTGGSSTGGSSGIGAVLNSPTGTTPVTGGGGNAGGGSGGGSSGGGGSFGGGGGMSSAASSSDSGILNDPMPLPVSDLSAGPSQNPIVVASPATGSNVGGGIGAASQQVYTTPTPAPSTSAGSAIPVGKKKNLTPTASPVLTAVADTTPGLVAVPGTGAGGLTLAEWQANVAARSPGASQSAINATALKDFNGTVSLQPPPPSVQAPVPQTAPVPTPLKSTVKRTAL